MAGKLCKPKICERCGDKNRDILGILCIVKGRILREANVCLRCYCTELSEKYRIKYPDYQDFF